MKWIVGMVLSWVSLSATELPQRIASLSPAASRILLDLGAGDQLVLATQWCELPERHPAAREADAFTPDFERLIKLKPDLVILSRLANPLLAERLRSLQLPVLVLSAEAPDSPATDIHLLGQRLGKDVAAQRLLDERRVTKILARDAPRLLMVWDGVCAGPQSYLAWVATASGYRLASLEGAWPEWDREQAGRSQPDVVLYLTRDGPETLELDQARLKEWQSDPALRLTNAALRGSVWKTRARSIWLPASGLPEAAALLRALPKDSGVR